VDLPQENKPVSSLSAVPGFVTHRRLGKCLCDAS
jgi:hypothetical protein